MSLRAKEDEQRSQDGGDVGRQHVYHRQPAYRSSDELDSMSDGLTFERRDVQIRELFGDGADGLGIHISHLMDE